MSEVAHNRMKQELHQNHLKLGLPPKFTPSLKFRELVADALLEHIPLHQLSQILVGILPFGSNQCWLLKFKKDYDVNLLSGIKLKIGDQEIPLVKLDDKTEKMIFLKFFWLTGVEKKEIANFLTDRKIDSEVIKKIDYEKTTFGNGLSVESGVIRVKLVVSSSSHQNILEYIRSNIIGHRSISGRRGFVSVVGDPVRCFYCRETGHIRTECTKRKENLANLPKTFASAVNSNQHVRDDEETPIDALAAAIQTIEPVQTVSAVSANLVKQTEPVKQSEPAKTEQKKAANKQLRYQPIAGLNKLLNPIETGNRFEMLGNSHDSYSNRRLKRTKTPDEHSVTKKTRNTSEISSSDDYDDITAESDEEENNQLLIDETDTTPIQNKNA